MPEYTPNSLCQILLGDALATLRELPDGIARCCVTSPPYWGLRDYQTGTWSGGDTGCAHTPRAGLTGGLRAIDDGQHFDRRAVCDCGAVKVDLQLGMEPTPDAFVARLVEIMREVRRVLTDDGSLWLNLGDSYASNSYSAGGYSGKSTLSGFTSENTKGRQMANQQKDLVGIKQKDLVGIPWMVAFALRADGWYLRSDIIWAKKNVMPESVTDRPTRSHEFIFLLTKNASYYYDHEAIKEPTAESSKGRYAYAFGGPKNESLKEQGHASRTVGTREEVNLRNKRDVWHVATAHYAEAHFATYPEALIEPCILAGSAEGDVVIDPFCGSGTTGLVSRRMGRKFVGIELNPTYRDLALRRIGEHATPDLFEVQHSQ